MEADTRPYRRCVGIALFNAEGRVFVGARIDMVAENWQLPQGGMEDGETPVRAAMRELEEEIGTDRAVVLAELEEWLPYRLPPALSGSIWGGRYQGQTQRWFAMRFTGEDSDIDLDTAHPEFRDWKWVDLEAIPDLTVPFKKAVYDRVVSAFLPFAAAGGNPAPPHPASGPTPGPTSGLEGDLAGGSTDDETDGAARMTGEGAGCNIPPRRTVPRSAESATAPDRRSRRRSKA